MKINKTCVLKPAVQKHHESKISYTSLSYITSASELLFEFDNLTTIVLKNIDLYIHSKDSNYLRAIITLILHELKESPYVVFMKITDMVPPIDEPDLTQQLNTLLNHFMLWREDHTDSYCYQFILELIHFHNRYSQDDENNDDNGDDNCDFQNDSNK